MIDDEWKIPNSRSLWRCSSRERRYIGLETVHGKRVKVSRGEGPVARQLALPAHSTSFHQNHVATLQFDSGVAFDSFFFVRFCVILVGPVGDVSPRLEELKNYPRSLLTPAWQRWSYNSIGTRGKCGMWGLIMYGEEEEGWLYANLEKFIFLTHFIELREITFLKIEMTVRVWESLRVSSEFSFFSPWQVYRTRWRM